MKLPQIKYSLLIALRYFKSKKSNYFISKISNTTIIIISLSITSPIITLSIINGLQKSIIEKIIHKDFHIKVTKLDNFYEENKIKEKLLNTKSIQKQIENIYKFYENNIIIQNSKGKYMPIEIKGIEKKIYQNSHLFKTQFKILTGSINLNKDFHVIIGEKLAKKINPTKTKYQNFLNNIKNKNYPLLKTILLKDQRNSSPEKIRIQSLLISGIFQTNHKSYDQNQIFTNLKTTQKLFNARIKKRKKYQNLISGLGIFLKDKTKTQQISRKIQNKLPKHQTQNWINSNSYLLYALKWEKTIMNVILSLIIISSVIITIYININMLIINKKKEIAILQSFGVKPKEIIKIFLIKALLISILGTSLGITLSIIILNNLKEIITTLESIINFFQNKANWKILSGQLSSLNNNLYKIKIQDILTIAFLPILISLVASYFPAKKIASKKIIENINEK